jgi:hypothetical protein
MSVVLVGANPGVLLRQDGEVTAFASVWQVDWSTHGAGTALVLWHNGRVRAVGDQPDLSRLLADTFVPHFQEVAGLPWSLQVEEGAVDIQLSLDTGLSATAGPVTVEISAVLDRRVFAMDSLTLGTVAYGLSNVYMPCRQARILLNGTAIPGTPQVEQHDDTYSSTAFLAVAEVWTMR